MKTNHLYALVSMSSTLTMMIYPKTHCSRDTEHLSVIAESAKDALLAITLTGPVGTRDNLTLIDRNSNIPWDDRVALYSQDGLDWSGKVRDLSKF